MYDQKQIEAATPWEIQEMVENIDHELQQTQLKAMQLKYLKKDLEIALCFKVSGHNYELAGKDHHGVEIYACSVCGVVER